MTVASQGNHEKFSLIALQEATKISVLSLGSSAVSTGCQQEKEMVAWARSLLYAHQPGKRQTKVWGNPNSSSSPSYCKVPLVRLSNFWWPTWAGTGEHGQTRRPGSKSKVELGNLFPKMPDEGRCGTARDVWVIASSEREKVSWGENSMFIPWDHSMLGLASALVLLLFEHLESCLWSSRVSSMILLPLLFTHINMVLSLSQKVYAITCVCYSFKSRHHLQIYQVSPKALDGVLYPKRCRLCIK